MGHIANVTREKVIGFAAHSGSHGGNQVPNLRALHLEAEMTSAECTIGPRQGANQPD